LPKEPVGHFNAVCCEGQHQKNKQAMLKNLRLVNG